MGMGGSIVSAGLGVAAALLLGPFFLAIVLFFFVYPGPLVSAAGTAAAALFPA